MISRGSAVRRPRVMPGFRPSMAVSIERDQSHQARPTTTSACGRNGRLCWAVERAPMEVIMAGKQNFTSEEWSRVVANPMTAGMAITAA